MVTLRLKHHKQEYELPTDFHELTLKQWVDISKPGLTTITLIERLTGADLTDYDFAALHTLGDTLAILLRPPDAFEYCPLGYTKLEDYSLEQVTRFEMAIQKKYHTAAVQHVECLSCLGISNDISAADSIALMGWYVDQLNAINEAWQKNMPNKATDVEIQAGIKKFDQFERWGTVVRLAQKDPTKMPAIWALPYKEVFNLCLYLYIEGEFNRNYQRLIMKK